MKLNSISVNNQQSTISNNLIFYNSPNFPTSRTTPQTSPQTNQPRKKSIVDLKPPPVPPEPERTPTPPSPPTPLEPAPMDDNHMPGINDFFGEHGAHYVPLDAIGDEPLPLIDFDPPQ
mmetsp:Transcript_15963/g.27331  ORF Transcript_15963/g.27331 Transcript_15963/m.27331 type:complete len:118 (+) Transcript_15963:1-354(+)